MAIDRTGNKRDTIITTKETGIISIIIEREDNTRRIIEICNQVVNSKCTNNEETCSTEDNKDQVVNSHNNNNTNNNKECLNNNKCHQQICNHNNNSK